MSPFGIRRLRRGRKVSPRLVALSSSAILAVYAAGYMQTRFPDDQLDLETLTSLATATPPAVIATATSAVTTGASIDATVTVHGAPGAPTAAATPPPATPPSASAPSPYQDGTYTDWGRGHHGTIQVEVVIADGLIVSAEIISCHTRYPCQEIAALPGQVVEIQGLRVRKVSGATESSLAYVRAVGAALRQASS